MAWNEIPAREDENLLVQAYYARTNILYGLLGKTSKLIFDKIWESAEKSTLESMKKSALVGLMIGDLIQALGLTEATDRQPGIGDWFLHSGTTTYRTVGPGMKEAEIALSSGVIKAVVRSDCCLTSTADVNMSGQDDISLVLGRLISPEKFDLVVAGYREPASSTIRLKGRHWGPLDRTITTDLESISQGDAWSSKLLELEIRGASDEYMLANSVLDTLSRFQSSIEDQGGWKLLHDDTGKAMHERQHQGMFRIFSRLVFGSLGVQLEPNTDHGSGPTDFTVRLKSASAIVEFKKDDKITELRHGISVQLPIYMRSAGATYGFYVVMCHSRDPEDVRQYLTGINDADPDLEFITCVIVDCRKRTSASKAATRSAVSENCFKAPRN
ncbi:hypothetical protein ACIQM0_27525 [Streptomyces sp. NPDC091387]|uniref:hypothetical protein n=1 Tax=Streptomyces sp. NPDC091387 TaxID=3365998 RepID=UPI003802AFB1